MYDHKDVCVAIYVCNCIVYPQTDQYFFVTNTHWKYYFTSVRIRVSRKLQNSNIRPPPPPTPFDWRHRSQNYILSYCTHISEFVLKKSLLNLPTLPRYNFYFSYNIQYTYLTQPTGINLTIPLNLNYIIYLL